MKTAFNWAAKVFLSLTVISIVLLVYWQWCTFQDNELDLYFKNGLDKVGTMVTCLMLLGFSVLGMLFSMLGAFLLKSKH
jgi:hypothetical protein